MCVCVCVCVCVYIYIYIIFTMIKKRGVGSTPIAGTFVKDKADVEQAGTIAADAAEGLVRAWRHSILIPPPACIFERGDNIVGYETPDIMVLAWWWSMWKAALELILWCSSVEIVCRKLTPQYDPWQPMIPYSVYVSISALLGFQ